MLDDLEINKAVGVIYHPTTKAPKGPPDYIIRKQGYVDTMSSLPLPPGKHGRPPCTLKEEDSPLGIQSKSSDSTLTKLWIPYKLH